MNEWAFHDLGHIRQIAELYRAHAFYPLLRTISKFLYCEAVTASGGVVVTLYTREGCHLCDEAKAVMAPMLARVGGTLREVDIDDDAALRTKYNESVPVIFVGEDFFARYRVDVEKFEKALANVSR